MYTCISEYGLLNDTSLQCIAVSSLGLFVPGMVTFSLTDILSSVFIMVLYGELLSLSIRINIHCYEEDT